MVQQVGSSRRREGGGWARSCLCRSSKSRWAGNGGAGRQQGVRGQSMRRLLQQVQLGRGLELGMQPLDRSIRLDSLSTVCGQAGSHLTAHRRTCSCETIEKVAKAGLGSTPYL